jgi:isoleucyl-tRNA synthetase
MKFVTTELSNFSQQDIARLEKDSKYSIPLGEDEAIELSLEEVEISSEDIPGWTVANKGPITVALDLNITPELEQEGAAREFINRIQKIRKDSGFDLTDRINVKVSADNQLKASLSKYNNYICAEILADTLEFEKEFDGGTDIEVNDNHLKVTVIKKG